jgi:enoyl-CoA hydratase
MLNSPHFQVDVVEPGIALLTLIPYQKKVFQFSRDVLDDMRRFLREFPANEGIKVLVITGTGTIFAAGADITQMAEMDAKQAFQFSELGQRVMDAIEQLPLVTLAAINGAALGGGSELALACDFRLAASTAKLGQPEINLGLIPGWGGCRRLARLVGQSRARHAIYSGETVTANQALEMGWVDAVAPAENLREVALERARVYAEKSGLILSYAKQAVLASVFDDDESAQHIERKVFGECFKSDDAREGMDAFLNKRAAQFRCTAQADPCPVAGVK